MRIADAVRQKASCDKRLVGAVVVLGNRIVSTMRIADAVRQKASCDKPLVGAVVVLGNRIVSTRYNGTPEGMTNCNQRLRLLPLRPPAAV
jgi:deoxycytidylate deaminase